MNFHALLAAGRWRHVRHCLVVRALRSRPPLPVLQQDPRRHTMSEPAREIAAPDPAYERHVAERGEWLRGYCTCRTRPDGSRYFACKSGCGREGRVCGGYCPSCFLTVMKTAAQPPQEVIDAKHLAHQREWSTLTFGPGQRTLGVLDHIRKELVEIEDDPTDLGEWVDVIILAFDGAWRHGWEPQQIIDAIKAKQAKNEARTWPDWRTMSADQAITPHSDRVRSSTITNPRPPVEGWCYRVPQAN